MEVQTMRFFKKLLKHPEKDAKQEEPTEPTATNEELQYYFICAVQSLFRPESQLDRYKKNEVAKFQMDDEQLLNFMMWMWQEVEITMSRMNYATAREKSNAFYDELVPRVKAHRNMNQKER
jgi:hypothetical protein